MSGWPNTQNGGFTGFGGGNTFAARNPATPVVNFGQQRQPSPVGGGGFGLQRSPSNPVSLNMNRGGFQQQGGFAAPALNMGSGLGGNFGAAQPQAFGAQPGGAFGQMGVGGGGAGFQQATTAGFGVQPAQTPAMGGAFGASPLGSFGGQPAQQPAFGQNVAPAFGTSFGSQGGFAGGFAQPAPAMQQPSFVQTSTASFGTSLGGGFGAQPAAQPAFGQVPSAGLGGGFGATPFGVNAQSAVQPVAGFQQNVAPAFGSPTGTAFANPNLNQQTRSSFQPHKLDKGKGNTGPEYLYHFASNDASPSQEEQRLSDYNARAGGTGGANPTFAAGGNFAGGFSALPQTTRGSFSSPAGVGAGVGVGFGAQQQQSPFTTLPAAGAKTSPGFGAFGGGFGTGAAPAKPGVGFGTSPGFGGPTAGGFGAVAGFGGAAPGVGGFGAVAGFGGAAPGGFSIPPVVGGATAGKGGFGFASQPMPGQPMPQAPTQSTGEYSQVDSRRADATRVLDRLEQHILRNRDAPPNSSSAAAINSATQSSSGLANKVLPAYRHTPQSTARVTSRSTPRVGASSSSSSVGRYGAETALSLLSPEHLLSRGNKISISSAAPFTGENKMDMQTPFAGGNHAMIDQHAGVHVDDHHHLAILGVLGGHTPLAKGMQIVKPALGMCAPTLTKPGYSCRPTTAEMKDFSDAQLSRLSRFEVENEWGKVVWENVDVRDVDLDKGVHLRDAEVAVYMDPVGPDGELEEWNEAIRPPVGEKLNRRAKVTYYRFHGDYDDVKAQCENNKTTFVSFDSVRGELTFEVPHFSSYKMTSKPKPKPAAPVEQRPLTPPTEDRQVFRMDDGMPVEPAPSLTSQSPTPVPVFVQAPSPAPFGGERMEAADEDELDAYVMRGHEEEDHQREEDMMEHEDSFLSPGQPQVAAPRVGGRASAPFKTSTCMRLLKKELEKQQDPAIVERNFQRGLTRFVTLNRSSVPGQMPANQFALSMGRSFRVGWGPFGLIAHAGTSFKSKEMSAICKNSSAPTVTIECVGPAASISGSGDGSPRTPAAGVDAPLYAFLRAQSRAPKPHRAPLLAAPRASLEDPEEYNRFLGFAHEVRDCIRSSVYAEAGPGSSSSSSSEHPHQPLLQAVELVIALVGQQMPIAPQPSVPLYEDRDARNPQMWECRREALSRWLQNVCVDEPRDEARPPPTNADPDTIHNRIFALLCCRRIAEAAQEADNAGLTRLAGLLLQAEGDAEVRVRIRKQIELWYYIGDSFKSVPPGLLRIYRLLGARHAGLLDPQDQRECILRGLGWKRALGCLFWFGIEEREEIGGGGPAPAGSLLEAVGCMEALRNLGLVDAPESPRPLLGTGCQAMRAPEYQCVHGVYSLLRALVPGEAQLGKLALTSSSQSPALQSLFPEAYGCGALDYRAPFIVLLLLQCCQQGLNVQNRGTGIDNSAAAAIVRNHLIAQLSAAGTSDGWKWAIVVALTCPQDHARAIAVRDLLSRWVGAKCGEDPQWEPRVDDEDYKFMCADLSLPQTWLWEAAAVHAGSRFEGGKQARFYAEAVAQARHEQFAGAALQSLEARARSSCDRRFVEVYVSDRTELKNIADHLANVVTELNPPITSASVLYHDVTKYSQRRECVRNDLDSGRIPDDEGKRELEQLRRQAVETLSRADALVRNLGKQIQSSAAVASPALQRPSTKALHSVIDLGTGMFDEILHIFGEEEALSCADKECVLQYKREQIKQRLELMGYVAAAQ